MRDFGLGMLIGLLLLAVAAYWWGCRPVPTCVEAEPAIGMTPGMHVEGTLIQQAYACGQARALCLNQQTVACTQAQQGCAPKGLWGPGR